MAESHSVLEGRQKEFTADTELYKSSALSGETGAIPEDVSNYTTDEGETIMAIVPLGKKLYIIPLEDPAKRRGIILPEVAKQRIDQGIVLYRGPLVNDIKVGDHVFFSGYSGTRIVIEKEGLIIILNEEEIDAVVSGEPSQLFTKEQLNCFIDALPTHLAVRGVEPKVAEQAAEILSSLVNDFLYAEGLRF